MGKLISMIAFIKEHSENAKLEEYNQVNETFVNKIINYANFLSEPLQLWMFVPCDKNNVPLDEPKQVSPDGVKWQDYVKQYQQAKERCYFEGFEIKDGTRNYTVSFKEHFGLHPFFKIDADWFKSKKYSTIEDLVKYNLTLTQTAKNRILS